MRIIRNEKFDEERALYSSDGIELYSTAFDGPADGESALKESKNIYAEDCYFNLRYPLWHCTGVTLSECKMTELCRAALWYTDGIEIKGSKLEGIKALRECKNIKVSDSFISSAELFWFSDGIELDSDEISGEYCMLRSKNIKAENLTFKGKYSFQYIENATFEGCDFDTKDAFWHAKNVVVRNSRVKGEYLAWYSENVTFENCEIVGTQPLCYCKGLKLINCTMTDCDLSFELSEVEATLLNSPTSIKNPKHGRISLPSPTELILDGESACKILYPAFR